MRINCPTCELEFEVSDKQVGQKALCPDCETRFIIPVDPEGDSEILSLGKGTEVKAAPEREIDGKEEEGQAMRPGDVGYGLKDGDKIISKGSPLASLWIGLSIGLVIGFVIGWLVWRSPEPSRVPFDDKLKSGSSSPFTQ